MKTWMIIAIAIAALVIMIVSAICFSNFTYKLGCSTVMCLASAWFLSVKTEE